MFFSWYALEDIDIKQGKFVLDGITYLVKYFTVGGLIANKI